MALGPGIPAYQYADDADVLAVRFAALEAEVDRLVNSPRPPGVGVWQLGVDPATGNLVAVNLKTNVMYPVQLGAGVQLST